MSELKPDDPRGGPKHVESKVVGDEALVEHDAPPPAVEDGAPSTQAEAPAQPDTMPAPTGEELVAAKYYAIAFLSIVIPLGLVLLGLVTIAFVRSLDFLK